MTTNKRKVPGPKGTVEAPAQVPEPEPVQELTILQREEIAADTVDTEEVRVEQAVRRIIQANRRFDFTAAGYPTQAAVKREVGFDVDTVVIATLVMAYREEMSTARPVPVQADLFEEVS